MRGGNKQKWLVLIAAFFCQVFSAGFGNSLGIFFVEFLETFQTGRGVVGWATSICSGLVYGAGLVVGIVVHKFGPRFSVIAGGLLTFTGLLSCSFAPNIEVIYVTFGVLTGTGCCLVCMGSFIAVGQHFDKGRGAATSLAVVGSGTGGLVFPLILRPVIDRFGWRGAMMILSAVMLNTLPAAGMFVPPKKKDNGAEKSEQEKIGIKKALCTSGIWRNAVYVCYVIICPVVSVGYQYTYIVMVDLGILRGFSKVSSTLLLTYMSMASTTSTLCHGLILRLLWRHSILLFNICLLIMSAILFIFPSLTSYEALIVGSVAYGVAIGGINGLYAIVTVDMLGLELYPTGFGFVCTGFGIGYLLSAPIAGVINDATGNYNLSFYVAGSLCIAGLLPLAVTHRVTRCKRFREKDELPNKHIETEMIIS